MGGRAAHRENRDGGGRTATRASGARALERLPELNVKHPLIGDLRGRGLLLGGELADVGQAGDRDGNAPAKAAAEAIFYRALDAGLSFKVTLGNVLTLTPPLVISEGDLDRALDILEGCIAEVG